MSRRESFAAHSVLWRKREKTQLVGGWVVPLGICAELGYSGRHTVTTLNRDFSHFPEVWHEKSLHSTYYVSGILSDPEVIYNVCRLYANTTLIYVNDVGMYRVWCLRSPGTNPPRTLRVTVQT